MAGNKKLEQGAEHLRNGDKSLKTSLLKWRPDYETAAEEYNNAATCFRVAKAYPQCRESLLKAAECHRQNRGLFYAAKALDQCILISKEMGDFTDIYSMAERAAHMFQSQGNPDSAVATLEKSAKILESKVPMEALNLYQHASEISLIQDNHRQAAEFVSKVARLQVKLKQLDQAADSLRREIGIHQTLESIQVIGRLVVALVLVQLARGDIVAAEKAFKEWGNYCDPPEMQNLEMLLQAYDEEDADSALKALNDPFIKHMDVEYAILSREIVLPQGGIILQKRPVVENATEEYVRVRPDGEEASVSFRFSLIINGSFFFFISV
ncbi:hypothetical protein ABEB36_000718 [Hypothenemus hampei]|uniref:Gamma-soluble NSF attachment protein n=1 Tax=Hypothenemus hampei TaxID=57062 RepID=A0ABD1FFG3_HYPHA